VNNTEEITKIVLHTHPLVDVRDQPWSIETCAQYLGISKSRFQQVIAPLPSFPKSFKLAGGHRRWMAGDVIDWVRTEYKKQTSR
jgi:predicted DNA-binding transcriptional regulator AlpA